MPKIITDVTKWVEDYAAHTEGLKHAESCANAVLIFAPTTGPWRLAGDADKITALQVQ